MDPLSLELLPDIYAICRLDADAAVPVWAAGPFVSVTRSSHELSVVCLQSRVPSQIPSERDWRSIRVEGPLSFSTTGVISSIAGTLASRHVTVFVVSTYDTDYVFVRQTQLPEAIDSLVSEGYRFQARPK